MWEIHIISDTKAVIVHKFSLIYLHELKIRQISDAWRQSPWQVFAGNPTVKTN